MAAVDQNADQASTLAQSEPGGRLAVLHLWWSDGSLSRQETYGPWAVADDGVEHLAQIHNFLRDWQQATGCRPDTATLSLVMDPGEWVREREARARADADAIARGVASQEEIQQMYHDPAAG